MKLNDTIDWQKDIKRSIFSSAASISRDFLSRYPFSIAFAIFILIISGLLEGIGILTLLPVFEMLVWDQASQNPVSQAIVRSIEWVGLPVSIPIMLLIIVVVIIFKSLLLFFAKAFVSRIAITLNKVLRIELMQALMRARWEFFTGQPTGRITNAFVVEANNTASAADALIGLASFTIQTAVYVISAFLISWHLTVGSVVAAVVMMVILWSFIKLTREVGAKSAALHQSYTSRILEWLQSAKSLKAMAREDRFATMLEAETYDLARTQFMQVLIAQALRALQEPITAVFIALGLLLAVQFLEVEPTTLIVMAGLFARTVGRIGGIQKSLKRLAVQEAPYFAFRRRLEAVNREAEVECLAPAGGKGAPASFEKSIRLEGVNLDYEGTRALTDVSLSIEKGRFVAVVGPSGAGKSTVLDLICALLVPTQGRVLVDGRDLLEIDRKQWRQLIGYVPQELTLFNASVRDNLSLGDRSVSDAMIEKALRRAQAWDFVAERFGGLDTMVGERGLQISGGQRQRLAIARAMIYEPQILLLDEATSAMDRDTERAFCEVLSGLTPEVTIVAISHRTVVEDLADLVYHLEAGRLVDRRDKVGPADITQSEAV